MTSYAPAYENAQPACLVPRPIASAPRITGPSSRARVRAGRHRMHAAAAGANTADYNGRADEDSNRYINIVNCRTATASSNRATFQDAA